jgi:hypothetical protein
MALIDTLKHIKFDELNDKQRRELNERLREQKRELQALIRALDRSLKKLKK